MWMYISTCTYMCSSICIYVFMMIYVLMCTVYICIYKKKCVHDWFAFSVVPCKSHNHPPNIVVEPLLIQATKHHPTKQQTKASTLEEHHAESGPDLKLSSIWPHSWGMLGNMKYIPFLRANNFANSNYLCKQYGRTQQKSDEAQYYFQFHISEVPGNSFVIVIFESLKMKDPASYPPTSKIHGGFFDQLHPVDWRFDGFGRSLKSNNSCSVLEFCASHIRGHISWSQKALPRNGHKPGRRIRAMDCFNQVLWTYSAVFFYSS